MCKFSINGSTIHFIGLCPNIYPELGRQCNPGRILDTSPEIFTAKLSKDRVQRTEIVDGKMVVYPNTNEIDENEYINILYSIAYSGCYDLFIPWIHEFEPIQNRVVLGIMRMMSIRFYVNLDREYDVIRVLTTSYTGFVKIFYHTIMFYDWNVNGTIVYFSQEINTMIKLYKCGVRSLDDLINYNTITGINDV